MCVTRSCCSNIRIKSLNKCDGWLTFTCLWWHAKGRGRVMTRPCRAGIISCFSGYREQLAGLAEQSQSKELGLCHVLTLLPADQAPNLIIPPLHGAHQTVSFSKTEPRLLPYLPQPIPSIKLQMCSLPVEAHFFGESRNATWDAVPQTSFSPPSCKMCLTLVCNHKSTLIFLVHMCTRSMLSSFWG